MSSAGKTEQLIAQLAERLVHQGQKLVTAESCTGGMIAASITAQAGSSAWFERGWVTYSNAAKTEELGVDAALINQHGAVSEAVAAAMARGACAHSHSDFAIAVTGIAGPDGGTPDKPVGTVCFGWANQQACRTETVLFTGDRAAIRKQSVTHALTGLLSLLSDPTNFSS